MTRDIEREALREAIERAISDCKFAQDVLGNSPPQFDSVRASFGIIADRLTAALTPDHARQVDGEVDWLLQQLEAWPRRVDPKKTTNIEYLMKSAAERIRQQHATPALIEAGDSREAMAAALSLLDTFAGEGLAHVYGDGRTVDATDLCFELCEAFGVDCAPGWWRKVAALSTASPPRSLETADVREALDELDGSDFTAVRQHAATLRAALRHPQPSTPVADAAEHGASPRPWRIVSYGDGDSLVIHDARGDFRVCFMATPGDSPASWERIKANASLIVQSVNAGSADVAAFGASDAACYLYPGEDQQAERAAFCAGAAHNTPVADAGMVLVPREPTEAMIAAGWEAYGRKADDLWSVTPTEEPDAGGGAMGYAYRAMIAAAPDAEGKR